MLASGKEDAPLPEPFQSLPPDRVVDLTAPLFGRGDWAPLTPDPEAALGLALRREATDEMPLTVGVYHNTLGTYGFQRQIQPKEVPARGYHLYKGGRCALSEWPTLFITHSWRIGAMFHVLYDPADPDRQWDFHISAKFTGPAYPHGKPDEPNALWIDRIVLVRADGG